jgi:hypothetical protein
LPAASVANTVTRLPTTLIRRTPGRAPAAIVRPSTTIVSVAASLDRILTGLREKS